MVKDTVGRYKEQVLVDLVPFPCRKCEGCRKSRQFQWSVRGSLEAAEHEQNCFITLTYDEEHNPVDELPYRHVQLFLKRLRKKIAPVKIRFMVTGEFGDKTSRPHWHMVIFGWCPNDLTRIHSRSRTMYSPFLRTVWQVGFNTVSRCTPTTIAYVVKYSQKGTTKSRFSNRPAIARAVFEKTVGQEDFYYGGRKSSVKYRQRVMGQIDPETAERIQVKNLEYSEKQFESLTAHYGTFQTALDAIKSDIAYKALISPVTRERL